MAHKKKKKSKKVKGVLKKYVRGGDIGTAPDTKGVKRIKGLLAEYSDSRPIDLFRQMKEGKLTPQEVREITDIKIAGGDFSSEEVEEAFSSESVESIDRSTSILGTVGTGLTALNSAQERPSSLLGGLGAAAQGLKTGMAFGGPIGAGIGALVGGGLGVANARQQTAESDKMDWERERQMYKDKTVSPSSFDLGGLAGLTGEEYQPTQQEKGEVFVKPDLTIPNSNAKKLHKDMDDEEITDVVPLHSYVFSNDKDMKIDAKEVADDVVNIGIGGNFEEGNYQVKEGKLGDIIGKKGKLTFADAAKKVRSKIRLQKQEQGEEDIFDLQSNEDNKKTRSDYLLRLIELQEQKKPSEQPEEEPVFKGGGRVKKYQEGGTADCPPGQFWSETLQQCIGSPEFFTSGVNGPLTDQYALPQSSGGHTPVYRPEVASLDPLPLNTPNIQDSLNQPFGVDQTVPQVATVSPEKQILDSLLNKYGVETEKAGQMAEDFTEDALSESSALHKRQKGRNLAGLASNTFLTMAQPTDQEVTTIETSNLGEQFRHIPESDVEGQISQLRNSQQALLERINQGAVSSKDIPALVAATQSKLIDAENKLRAKFVGTNRELDRKKAAELDRRLNLNNEAFDQAKNLQTELRAQKIAQIGKGINNFLNQADSQDSSKVSRENALKSALANNQMNIIDQSLELGSLHAKLGLEESMWRDGLNKMFEEWSEIRKNNENNG